MQIPGPVRPTHASGGAGWGLLVAAPFIIASCSTHRGSESEVQLRGDSPRSTHAGPGLRPPRSQGPHRSPRTFAARWCLTSGDMVPMQDGDSALRRADEAPRRERPRDRRRRWTRRGRREAVRREERPALSRAPGDGYTANRFGGVNALPTTFGIDRGGHRASTSIPEPRVLRGYRRAARNWLEPDTAAKLGPKVAAPPASPFNHPPRSRRLRAGSLRPLERVAAGAASRARVPSFFRSRCYSTGVGICAGRASPVP